MTVQKSLIALIVIIGIFNCVKFSDAKNSTCEAKLSKFHSCTTNFLECAINNAEPVTYCHKCGNFSAQVIIKYNDLEANCTDKYFNQDRLNIVHMAYSNAQSLWNAGSCSNCYDWVDGQQNQTLSKTTTQFLGDWKNFTNCVKTTDKKTVCSDCVDDYNKMNDLYNEIKKNTDDIFCFDIKDAMNKTRLNWSHNLKCCKDRKTSLTAFIVSSVVISVLIPFFFYTAFMFFGWRREQLHDPLIDSDIEPSVSRQLVETDEPPSSVPVITQLLDLDSSHSTA